MLAPASHWLSSSDCQWGISVQMSPQCQSQRTQTDPTAQKGNSGGDLGKTNTHSATRPSFENTPLSAVTMVQVIVFKFWSYKQPCTPFLSVKECKSRGGIKFKFNHNIYENRYESGRLLSGRREWVVSGCLLEGDDADLMMLMMITLRLPGQSHTRELQYFSNVHC